MLALTANGRWRLSVGTCTVTFFVEELPERIACVICKWFDKSIMRLLWSKTWTHNASFSFWRMAFDSEWLACAVRSSAFSALRCLTSCIVASQSPGRASATGGRRKKPLLEAVMEAPPLEEPLKLQRAAIAVAGAVVGGTVAGALADAGIELLSDGEALQAQAAKCAPPCDGCEGEWPSERGSTACRSRELLLIPPPAMPPAA